MLKLLTLRELGVIQSSQVRIAETTRRSCDLQLSDLVNVEPVHRYTINCLHIDPSENRYLLSCDSGGLVHIHDTHNNTSSPRYTCAHISSTTRDPGTPRCSIDTAQWYTHDNGLFHSSGADKKLKVWDTNCMKIAAEFSFNGPVYTHQMSPLATHHSLVAVGYQGSHTRLVDLRTSSSIHSLKGHAKATLALAWSPSQEFLLSTAGADSKIVTWDVRKASGALLTLDQHNGDAKAHSSRSVNTAHDGRVNSLLYLADGQRLLSCGTDDTLRLWNSHTGRNELINYGLVSNSSRKTVGLACSGMECRPTVVYVPTDSDVEVYEVFTGEHVATLRGHYNRVNWCLYNMDTQEVYSAGVDRSVLVWTPQCDAVEAYGRILKGEKEEGNMGRRTVEPVVMGVRADDWSSDED